jgi:hypothetical protein
MLRTWEAWAAAAAAQPGVWLRSEELACFALLFFIAQAREAGYVGRGRQILLATSYHAL